MSDTAPKYPLFIVSKGRHESRLTARALDSMNVPYRVIIEEQEFDAYASVIAPERLLILPERYFDEYDVCDHLGRTKSTGPGAARNFAWDTAQAEGYARHWVMDDNIRAFYRLNRNDLFKVRTGGFWRCMEDFVDRYSNVAMAGPNYFMFVPRKAKVPPFVLNTRIYSCNLILNSSPYRWRGRYNEDTDLSLRMLKDGWCTVQFNAMVQYKVATQTIKGGNTEEFYAHEGTYPKSKMQVDLHPDVSRLVYRFGRVHHHVDYSPFKANRLKKIDANSPPISNEYGMKLVRAEEVQNVSQ